MPEKLYFIVPDEYDNAVALTFLKKYCGFSSRMITRLKREKDGILLEGKILRTVDKVRAGSTVSVSLPSEEASFITPVKGELDIKYEDAHLLIVNKPPSMPVHPVKQHQTNTLANIVADYMNSRGESYVFRALNRLDKDTSGLVIIVKDKYCAYSLKSSVYKEYYALCHGTISEGGTIRKPIGLTEKSKVVRYVLPEGVPAVTHYEPVQVFSDYSLVKLWLETGKTHQIRCHMAYLGHPLLGDDLYGGDLKKISRQALHCGHIELSHPVSNEKIIIDSDLPGDMQYIINKK